VLVVVAKTAAEAGCDVRWGGGGGFSLI